MTYILTILVILVAALFLIEWIFEQLRQVLDAIQDFFLRFFVDKNKSIVERNKAVIQKYLNNYQSLKQNSKIENMIRDCIIEIAKNEGRSSLISKLDESFSGRQPNSGIPKTYIILKDHLKDVFSNKHKELLAEDKKRYEKKALKENKAKAQTVNNILTKHKDLVDKFLEIAERKVSIIDDYGDENWDVLPIEIMSCIKKISQRENDFIDWQDYTKRSKRGNYFYLPEPYEWIQEELEKIFKENHSLQKNKPAEVVNFNNLSGIEFETFIVKLLIQNGFDDVRGTPASGDQGADIIAKKDGKTILIQAKRYKEVVSNKAVQEIISAISYYGGDEGWVVTNSTFSASAKALAQKGNIKLIDGNALNRIIVERKWL
jgi:Restriction endonuclease